MAWSYYIKCSPPPSETFDDLSHSFIDVLLSITREYYDTILVFDTFKDVSLKYATREYMAMKVLTYNTDSPKLVILRIHKK